MHASKFLLAVLVISFYAGCSKNEVDSKLTPSVQTPKLWEDKDAAAMVRAVQGESSANKVYVLRWSGGTMHGIAVLTDRKHEIRFDPTDNYDQVSDYLQRNFTLEDVTGWMVVCLNPVRHEDGVAESYDVDLHLNSTTSWWNRDTKKGVDEPWANSWRGNFESSDGFPGSLSSGSWFRLGSPNDPLLELNIESIPSLPQSIDEP